MTTRMTPFSGIADGSFFEEKIATTPVGQKLLSCLQCGICTASCVTASAWGFTPRQVIRLVQLGRKEDILSPEILSYCAHCYSCNLRCPMGIDIVDLSIELRNIATQEGLWPLPDHVTMVQSTKDYNNPYLQPRAARDRWTKKIQPDLRKKLKLATKEKCEVLYYPGCTAAYNPNQQPVAVATTEVLIKAGVDLGILGKEGRCCASTSWRVGDKELFEKYAYLNIEQWNSLGIKILVTACAGCYGIINEEYRPFGKLEFEVLHTSEYMLRLIRDGKIKLHPVDMTVTYHDPCHLGRHGGIYDAPREVMASIPGIKLVEMERIRENSRCCGAGGGVRTVHPDWAVFLAKERIKEAKLTGAESLISCCPFCETNLAETLGVMNEKMSWYDLSQLVLMAMD